MISKLLMTNHGEIGCQEGEAPVSAWCDDANLHMKLADGREIMTPLCWYPSALAASHRERNSMELMFSGVQWPDLDEDLSISGKLRGWSAPQNHGIIPL